MSHKNKLNNNINDQYELFENGQFLGIKIFFQNDPKKNCC